MESDSAKQLTPADRHVAQRLKEYCDRHNITYKALAEASGVKSQQVSKYMDAVNRIAAGRLYYIARALGLPVSYFYDGFETEGGEADGFAEPASDYDGQGAETEEVLHLWSRIEDHGFRDAALRMMRGLTGPTEQD